MKLTVNLGKDSYPIYIENNILSQAGDYIRKIYHGKRIMIISDDNVFPLYGDRLIHTLDSTYECHHLVLPHGESTKDFQTLPTVYKAMLEAKISRSDLVIALGGGVIGLEMATYYAMADVDTTVVEMQDHIGGPSDRDMVKILQKNCEAEGMHFLLNAKVTEIREGSVIYEQGGKTCTLPADKVLLSIGRKPNTAGIGLENVGVLTERGAIVTDERMQTNVPGIYAVGDANGKAMLAHTAYREAEVAVNNILGKRDRMRYQAIPSVLYTVPELSSVGETEESAKAKGYDVKVVKLPMSYSGRYVAENQGGDGICKLVFDKRTKTLLGAQALANYSSEFIIAAGICMELELTVADMKEIVFPHPTVAEILREAICKY